MDSNNIQVRGSKVADVFVSHYHMFLGGDMACNNLNMDGLFSKKVSADSFSNMARPITNDEIKKAMFSIGEDRAPGPDGFSSAFFKKGWDIVGVDIFHAIRYFFVNGILLKEITHTFIALIPKVTTPLKVNDFWPISCCNVIYKCISKILTNRIIDGIKEVVSDNQYAFVLGRRISDNILITQELMHNYHPNIGPPRCAFKIDIQKAYDTVDCRFLKCILKGFGFNPRMIKWIIACVTSTSFSLSLNGDIHGFLKGKRGLRQGDPLSPYLFTLVTEILSLILRRKVNLSGLFRFHKHCEDLQIINVCFVDDLFIFARRDVDSANIIRESFDEFKSSSRLVPSIPKSTTFFCNVPNYVKIAILNIMPFGEGVLLVKYLGVPLISSRLLTKDCKVLVEKAKHRIGDWKNKSLSFAGRLQL
ncbi:putative RNA-directed DNA polymerase, eukaryota, reverse transcriptase zinc-binding domain protein [Tanacetum coccineum]